MKTCQEKLVAALRKPDRLLWGREGDGKAGALFEAVDNF